MLNMTEEQFIFTDFLCILLIEHLFLHLKISKNLEVAWHNLYTSQGTDALLRVKPYNGIL